MEQAEKREDIEDNSVPKMGYVTSVAWTWFGYARSDPEQTDVLCKLCKKTGERRALFSKKTSVRQAKIQDFPVFCCVQLRHYAFRALMNFPNSSLTL